MLPENQEPTQSSPERQAYLQEFLQLKIEACYIRDYRNGFNRYVTAAATIRAIASSGSVALWAIWQEHAIIWATIIAASQVADALKDVFLFPNAAGLSVPGFANSTSSSSSLNVIGRTWQATAAPSRKFAECSISYVQERNASKQDTPPMGSTGSSTCFNRQSRKRFAFSQHITMQ